MGKMSGTVDKEKSPASPLRPCTLGSGKNDHGTFDPLGKKTESRTTDKKATTERESERETRGGDRSCEEMKRKGMLAFSASCLLRRVLDSLRSGKGKDKLL